MIFELGLQNIAKEMVVHMIFVDTILYLIHIYLPHSGISLDVRQNLLVTPFSLQVHKNHLKARLAPNILVDASFCANADS